MALITNPVAVTFCNEKVRPIADRYAQLYWLSKIFITEWNANNLGAIIPNTADTIDDKGDLDGRGLITGAMVNGLKTNLQAVITDLEASSNLKLNGLSVIAVHEQP
jgi:hypothetical protein